MILSLDVCVRARMHAQALTFPLTFLLATPLYDAISQRHSDMSQ